MFLHDDAHNIILLLFISNLISKIIISFHIVFGRFFLKHEELSDARVASITKKECGFEIHFL